MKNRIIRIGIVLLCLVVTMSCNKDFLDTKPLDRVKADEVWKDAPLSQAFVFSVYSYLGYGGFEEQMLAAYTDEAMFTHAGRNINTFTEGSESASNLAWRSATYNWDDMYKAIREANIAITNLPNATFDDQKLKDQLLGESHFLRAYYYQQLVRFYGGVPIVETVYGLNEDYSVPRSSYKDCIDYIIADLDKAQTLLTGKLDGKSAIPGRASTQACLALKSRVLLYAASDLHNIDKLSGSTILSGYTHPELIGYTDGTAGQDARWEKARLAAKAVLDATSGYKMNLAAPVTKDEGVANYIALSMGGGSNVADKAGASDLIFQRTETPLYTQENNWPLGGLHVGINNGPNGYHNWSGNTPIQQLVDDYQMMDGSKFDWENGTHAADPFASRDPRFYATILYDGADWKPRPSDVAASDPANQIQSGYYDGVDKDGKAIVVNGIDTRESSIESWNGSRTHYWVRKFIDPDPTVFENQSSAQIVPWPFIRYTEAVLNFVEASIERGNEADAKDWLNKIRYRAGMPEITESGTALRDLYRNERRIELAYEEHRYHDARRWLIAPSTLGRPIQVIYVKGNLKVGKTPLQPYKHDKTVYDYVYTVQGNSENEKRKWDDKMYYRPIDRNEISRNAKLKGFNNPGYGDE